MLQPDRYAKASCIAFHYDIRLTNYVNWLMSKEISGKCTRCSITQNH